MTIESIDHDKCVGCGTCVETCPADVIRLNEKLEKSQITYPEDCQSCHLCRLFCPVREETGVDVITISIGHVCERPMISWG